MFWFFLLSLSTWNQIVRFKKNEQRWLRVCVCVCDASLALVRTGWSRSLGPDILSCIFLAFAVFVLCHRPVSTGNKQKKKCLAAGSLWNVWRCSMRLPVYFSLFSTKKSKRNEEERQSSCVLAREANVTGARVDDILFSLGMFSIRADKFGRMRKIIIYNSRVINIYRRLRSCSCLSWLVFSIATPPLPVHSRIRSLFTQLVCALYFLHLHEIVTTISVLLLLLFKCCSSRVQNSIWIVCVCVWKWRTSEHTQRRNWRLCV